MLDFISIILLTIMVLLGLYRGFIKELVLLLVVVLSIFFTIYTYDIFIEFANFENSILMKILSIIFLYAVSMISLMIANSLILEYIKPIRLGFFDRILGAVVGVLKTTSMMFFVIVTIKVAYLSFNPIKKQNDQDNLQLVPLWVSESFVYMLYPGLEKFVDIFVSDDLKMQMSVLGENIVQSFDVNTTKKNNIEVQKEKN